MADPINTTTMPGDNMNPDNIEAAAGQIRTVGSNVATTGGDVAKAWSGLKKGYQAPEQGTLFGAMQPAQQAATDFSTDMGKVATALQTFAGEVRAIKASVAKIRSDANAFLAGIHDGKVTVTQHVVQNRAQLEMGESTTTHKAVDWDSDQASVDANNALIRRTNDQQEQLWAAERRCANAINDVYGGAHIAAASESNPNGYGVNAIPDNAETPWGHTVERKEGCGDKVVKGVFVDGLGGMAEGITSLVGFSWSGPGGAGFSWSTAGHAWNGLAHLATGGPLFYPLALLPGPVGSYIRTSVKTNIDFVPNMVGIDVFAKDPFAKWKGDPARTFGSSLFNVGSLLIPVGGEVSAGGKVIAGGAKVADGTGDVAKATRGAEGLDGLGDIGKVTGQGADLSRIAGSAGKTELGDLGKVTDDLGSGVKGLDKTDIDVPNVPHNHVNIDHPNVGDHAPGDVPEPRDPGHGDVGSGDGTSHDGTGTGHDGNGHDPAPGQGDGTQESPRKYEYSNAAENLHGTHEPTPSQLDHIGPSKDYPAGSHDHMVARWHEYEGKWSWDRWRDTYIRNQGHHARGAAYEQAYADAKHLTGDDWTRNTSIKQQTGVDRNYDFVSRSQQEAIEMKSGDKIDMNQLAKDEKLIRAGWDVKYVFGREPTASTIEALAKAGAQYEIFYGDPILVK